MGVALTSTWTYAEAELLSCVCLQLQPPRSVRATPLASSCWLFLPLEREEIEALRIVVAKLYCSCFESSDLQLSLPCVTSPAIYSLASSV